MDPRINAVWLSRVSEARSFVHLLAPQPLMGVTIAAVPLAALCFSVARLRKTPDAALLGLTVLLAMTCAVGLVQVRGIAVATAAAIPLAAAGLTRLPQLNRLSPLLAGLAVGVLANSTMLGAFLGALAPANVAIVVHVLFLLMIALLLVTGPLSVWSTGRPIQVFDLFSLPSPFSARAPTIHEFAEEVHEAASKLFWPLIILHVGGALKHLVVNRDRTLQRMLWVGAHKV